MSYRVTARYRGASALQPACPAASPSSLTDVRLKESSEAQPADPAREAAPAQEPPTAQHPRGPARGALRCGPRSRGGRRAPSRKRRTGSDAPRSPGPLWAAPARAPRGAAAPPRERALPAASSPRAARTTFLPPSLLAPSRGHSPYYSPQRKRRRHARPEGAGEVPVAVATSGPGDTWRKRRPPGAAAAAPCPSRGMCGPARFSLCSPAGRLGWRRTLAHRGLVCRLTALLPVSACERPRKGLPRVLTITD